MFIKAVFWILQIGLFRNLGFVDFMLEFPPITCPNSHLAPLFQDTCSVTEIPTEVAQTDLKTVKVAKELLRAMALAGFFFFIIPPILGIVGRLVDPVPDTIQNKNPTQIDRI